MALTLEEALNQKEQNVDVMPKNITMQQASEIDTWDSLIYGQNRPNIVSLGSYQANLGERVTKGFNVAIDSAIKDTIPAIQLGLSNADLAIGGYFGADEEVIKRKQANIATIQRNFLASQKERYKNITPQTADSWSFGLGQGAANLLTMYVTGGVAGGLAKAGLMGATKAATAQAITGIATGTMLENIEQQSERIPLNEQGDVDVEKLTPGWAKKSSIGTTAYLATSALLEKYVGFGKQTTMWQTPIKFSNKTLKNMSPALIQAGKGLLSEGATEGLQSLTSSGILLAEGTIKMSDMPERLQQAWKEAVIGGILGGSVGVAVGINQQNNVKKMLDEEIIKVVADPQERENIVDAIWEAGTNEMTTVISKELELSSELNAKHGSIYDNMASAIAQAIADSGSFVKESEADIAQYVSETAKMFANQVLAEANKRGCYIDEVLKAGDIAYMDGKIQLKAGDKILAETPVIGDETVGKQNREALDIAYTLLSMATGKDKTYIKATLNAKSNNSSAQKRQEVLEQMLAEADDTLDIDIEPSWKKYFNFDEDYSAQKTQSLIEQALSIINNGGIVRQQETKEDYHANIINQAFKVYRETNDIDALENYVIENVAESEQADVLEYIYNKLAENKLFQAAASAGANENEIAEAEKEYAEKGTESKYFKRYTDNAPLVGSEEALNYEFKTGKKVAVNGFHGTQRGDRVGSVFRPDRATSGPMAFFSSDRQISENYAKGKQDTSLSDDMGDYDQWFKLKIGNNSLTLKDAWWNLTSKQRQEIAEKAPHITLDWDAEEVIYDENTNRGLGNYDYGIKRNRGNALKTLVESWLTSGSLYDREDDFLKVLELVGIKREDIDYIDPYTDHSKVYDVFIAFKNPLVTTDLPKKVVKKLEKEAPKNPAKYGSYGDPWDKNTQDGVKWITTLKEDIAKNENSFVWTSIPDWVTDVLKSFGYDGIIDVGGKSGGGIHKVYIPFSSEQIKSVDNRGTFDEEDPNIYYQAMHSQKTIKKAREVKQALQKIANGSEEETVKNLRDDLDLYGGTNDVTFVFGDEKKGIVHIANKHGGIKTLLNVFDTVIDGQIIRYVEKNKTVVLEKNGYEAILSLDEHGKTKTWLLSGWNTKISPDEEREFNATLKTTQNLPTFSRQELGAGLNNIITKYETELNPNVNNDELSQIKGLPKIEFRPGGMYYVSEKAIELTNLADYSTLPHELAHYWLDNMWAYTRTGKASSAYMNNFNAMADWLGIKEGQISITRNQHEKFARGYEKYLLQGYAPNGLIQGAFDDYDRWLKRVYLSAKQLKVKLSPAAIEFFNTMTTGELPEYTVEETQKEIFEKNLKEAQKSYEETKKVVVEKQAEFNGLPTPANTTPVVSDGEKKQSAVFTKQAEILGIAEELNYNKANIEEQNKKANEFVANNLEKAERIVKGLEKAPDDILKNAIFNAYLKQMLAIGNVNAYLDALKTQSLELTRAGQEIASQRNAIENIFDPAYWIRKIETNAKNRLAVKKFGSMSDETGEIALSKMNEYIEREINSQIDAYLDATPEERTKIVEKLSKKITSEFGVKPPETLYQSLYEPSEIRTRTNAYNYIYKAISGDLGISLTKEQANEVISKTTQIQKAIESTRGRGGNPSVLFFKNLSEMENYANSLAPSPSLAVLTSTVGRGNMLFSPKSLVLNIESNILNFVTEALIKRVVNNANNLAVDPQTIKDYLTFSKEVYHASGYQLSSMPEIDPTRKILSKKMTTSQGEGWTRALGRFYEQTIFKYGLGYPDLIFKDLAFTDTANLLATQYAKGDSKKATEIFKDVILVEPKTEIGQQIREIAINDALIATYQNKGTISKFTLDMRNAMNKASKSLMLGDLLSPFVKTPANVIGLGLDYTFGGAYALTKVKTIINDFKNGELTETSKKAMRSLSRNGLGLLVSFMLAALIDDEDYIPDYALLSPKERDLVKLKGGVYNSIKIGDKYYSLDYFGTLGLPLVSILNARRGNDLKEKVFKYVQGAGFQSLKLPVVGDLKKLLENTSRTLGRDVGENIKVLEDATIDFVSSRSLPAILTDVAKITDEYERDTQNKAFNRLMSKLPIIRENLPAQYNYGTGRPVETQSAISTLFAGARVKQEISNSVINEIDRLSDKNTETKVTLSKVTKLGKLSSLSDDKKIKAEKEFAKQYSTEVNTLIKTYKYKKSDDEQKVKLINKVRDKVRDRLKKQYGLNKRSK